MKPTYVPIVKARQGEFKALAHLDNRSAQNIIPLFEVPKITDKERGAWENKGLHPLISYLNYKAEKIAAVRKGRFAFIDTISWKTNSYVENGEHSLNFLYNSLESNGVFVNPVIGYDRWDDVDYRNAVMALNCQQTRTYCIRLEMSAIEDFLDPNYFQSRIKDIVDSLAIDPKHSCVLIDFGDVSQTSILDIQTRLESGLSLLSSWQFMYIAMAGASTPTIINAAVKNKDSTGVIIRREMNAWRAIKMENPSSSLVFGDYCVRNPSSAEDIIAPDANGKIRYTIQQNYFVARGHSRQIGNKYDQHYVLAETIAKSTHFLGANFSWGDNEILLYSKKVTNGPGNATTWISIDTNHHITYVILEVIEFENQLMAANLKRALQT